MDSVEKVYGRIKALLVVMFVITLIFSSYLLHRSYREKQQARHYALMEDSGVRLVRLAGFQGLERGMGTAILADPKHAADIAVSYKRILDDVDKEANETDSVVRRLIAMEPGDSGKLNKEYLNWRAAFDAAIRLRPSVINNEIDTDSWFNAITESIKAGMILRETIFSPDDDFEVIYFYNSLLRNVSQMCEYLGRDRAKLVGVIAKGERLDADDLELLRNNQDNMNLLRNRVLTLIEIASLPHGVEEAIRTFEESYRTHFLPAREKIVSAGKAATPYPVSSETWFSTATETINTGLMVGNAMARHADEAAHRIGRNADYAMAFNIALVLFTMGAFGTAVVYLSRTRKMAVEMENMMRRVVEGSPLPKVVLDQNGMVLMLNQKFTEVFGYTVMDMPDTAHWWPLAFPDEEYRAKVKAAWAETVKAAASGLDVNPRHSLVTCRDGSVKEVIFYYSVIAGGAGVAVLYDVTERRKAERRLAQNQAMLANAQRIAHVGSWEWDITTGSLAWSDEIYRIFGLKPQQFGATYEAFLERVHPTDRAKVQESVKNAVDGKARYHLEHRIVRPNGEERVVEEEGEVERDDNGNAVRMVGVVYDISERWKEQISLIENRSVLQQIATGAPLFEILERIAKMVEFKVPGSMVAINLVDRLHGKLRHGAAPSLPEEYNSAIDGISYGDGVGSCGTSAARKEEIIVDDISTHPYWELFKDLAYRYNLGACWAVPAKSADGEVLATVGMYFKEPRHVDQKLLEQARVAAGLAGIAIMRDRREKDLLMAKENAEAASRAKSDFLANMSHELRTPLNGIIGITEILLAGGALGPAQTKQMELVKTSGDALLSLVNDVLDLARIEAGRFELDNTQFNIVELVERTGMQHAVTAQGKGLELVVGVDNAVPHHLIGDPNRLRQVLVNLMGNSIKFTSAGEVVVNVSLEESTDDDVVLHFSIRDTGIGIPAEKISAIFERFTQADETTTRKYGGAGLGTTISKQLVELMGGSIWAESVVGMGSTFHFTARFKLDKNPGALTPVPLEELRKLRVLIVDDNGTNRYVLRHMLESWGMDYREAESGNDALAQIGRAREANERFDIILMDYNMPEHDGIETAHMIRTSANAPVRPLIFLLSSITVEMEDRLKTHDIDGFVTKPVRRSDLLNLILTTLGRSTAMGLAGMNARGTGVDLGGKISILLVEDNEVNREVATYALAGIDHDLSFAFNGQEGVEKWRSGKYDLILMDIHMPVMDGLEATRTIRAEEKSTGKHTPIIAMTARAMEQDRQECLSAGMDEYISKPIKKSDLIAIIASVLGGKVVSSATAKPAAEKVSPVYDLSHAAELVDNDPQKIGRLVKIFIDSTTKQLKALEQAVAAADAKEVCRLAHSVKGSASQIGAEALRKRAFELEQTSRNGELATAKQDCTAIKELFANLEQALRKEYP